MTQIRGIYAAGMSIFKDNLSLDVDKTIEHSEKLIQMGCHGVAIFGSTGQAQLISISEKIDLLNKLSTNENKSKFLVGTGLNSLSDTINLMQISCSLGLNKFLVMPPAYYKYQDEGAINFYTKIINQIPECKIILYNFEKLCGYKFSVKCVETLASKFPKQIIGVKDSTYNLFRELKIKNFSIFPGSELKLLSGLEIGCAGIITATCNATAELSRKVFDDFEKKKTQTANEKLCKVRKVFDQFNLISGLHSFLGKKNKIYKNLLPPLNLLNEKDEKKLLEDLSKLDFN
jgi:4-hydroxy-tetrahydrodipicolinate synthase|tara:strand:- start:2522 stop:3385 length:864 start_codon:yes stop_codon:yes gene_type:complete